MSETLSIQTPRVFQPLLKDNRYKGAYGGRGSGKSHFFAEGLVEKCIVNPGSRWVCVREVQKSLAQSVKKLIEDKIQALKVERYFQVMDTEIRTIGGGIISFQGMNNHTAGSIKSLEGYDGAWVEEAQALSLRSLRLLRPTIRKPDSEVWFSWNPELPTDPVDELFRGPDKITDAALVEVSWKDNPWFPDVLEEERKRDLSRDPDEYNHVWEGGYITIAEAVVFRNRVEVREFETPEATRFFHGADWGFSADPTVLIRCFVLDNCLYIDQEAYGKQVELDDIPSLFDTISTSRRWPIKADNARPETISYVRRKLFNVSAATKWSGSILDGIACLKAFTRIFVHPRCVEAAREFRLYSFKVDSKNGDVLPIIIDKHNHCIDALRYALDGYIKGRGMMSISKDQVRRI